VASGFPRANKYWASIVRAKIRFLDTPSRRWEPERDRSLEKGNLLKSKEVGGAGEACVLKLGKSPGKEGVLYALGHFITLQVFSGDYIVSEVGMRC